MRMSKKTQRISFFYGFLLFLIWYLVCPKWTQHVTNEIITATTGETTTEPLTETYQNSSLKYILQWNKPVVEPFTFMKVGQDLFIDRRCPVNNCYVTWNRTYLTDYINFDVILFYCHDVSRGFIRLPRRRSVHQKYVFASPEAAGYYPVYHEKYDGFFNWTWTYKLDSDIFYGYILIRDREGKIIGPRIVMNWPKIEEMKPIEPELREKLSGKKKAAAWFVSNCYTRGGREKVATQIKQELTKYNMTLDIYGACGKQKCPNKKACWEMLQTDYYFYLSFENSISEDYVSEKLLNALQHYTVPIVYGGANYTRFMPEGIYLNARTLTIEELVKQMIELIKNKEKYFDSFRWHNHYTYYYAGDTPETDYYCSFCKKINNEYAMKQISVYQDFAKWWNGWNIGSSNEG